MSAFLTIADYTTAIEKYHLDRISTDEADPGVTQAARLDQAETQAIAMMEGFLASRYLTADIFGATGSDRHPIIVKYAVDIAIYYLYSRQQPEQVPQLRKDNYDIAERWLRRVSQGEINPTGLPKPDNGSKDYIAYGSNPKQTLHLT